MMKKMVHTILGIFFFKSKPWMTILNFKLRTKTSEEKKWDSKKDHAQPAVMV